MHVLETCLYALDLEAAERFYVDVVGLELHSREPERHVFLRCGNSMVLIFNPARTSVSAGHAGDVSVPAHGATGPGHVAFGVEDLAPARRSFARHAVEIEAEISWPRGGKSIYVRDPAGNSVELVEGDIWRR